MPIYTFVIRKERNVNIYSRLSIAKSVFRMTGDLILQVTYVTKNPQAPVAFYQCSDITVTAGPPY